MFTNTGQDFNHTGPVHDGYSMVVAGIITCMTLHTIA